jgi:hypothetical protein
MKIRVGPTYRTLLYPPRRPERAKGARAAQIPLGGISLPTAIIITVDSSWRMSARARGSAAIITVPHPLLGLNRERSTSAARRER